MDGWYHIEWLAPVIVKEAIIRANQQPSSWKKSMQTCITEKLAHVENV